MSKVIWTPSILKELISAHKKGMNHLEVWDHIRNNANSDDVNTFISHFIKKSKKLNKPESELILKRVKSEISSAKQIIKLGDDCLEMWIYNIGPARTYAWRKQKKIELSKK